MDLNMELMLPSMLAVAHVGVSTSVVSLMLFFVDRTPARAAISLQYGESG